MTSGPSGGVGGVGSVFQDPSPPPPPPLASVSLSLSPSERLSSYQTERRSEIAYLLARRQLIQQPRIQTGAESSKLIGAGKRIRHQCAGKRARGQGQSNNGNNRTRARPAWVRRSHAVGNHALASAAEETASACSGVSLSSRQRRIGTSQMDVH